MTRVIEWLLDLQDIRLASDAPVLVKFAAQVPVWALFCCALAGVTWIVLIYRREETTLRRRIVLSALRAAIVALVGVVLCRPSLVFERNSVEQSRVVLLTDTSHSMASSDRYRDDALAGAAVAGAGLSDTAQLATQSRLDLIKGALLGEGGAALSAIIANNDLQLCTFSGTVETQGFAASDDELPSVARRIEALVADGTRTDLAGAIHRAIEEAQGRRLAALVLASDGQTTESSSLKDVLDMARGRRIPILPIRIGSPERPKDIDLGPALADESVFVNDLVAVEIQLAATGLTEPVIVPVRLIDEATGEDVASTEVLLDPDNSATTVELRVKPARAGRFRWRIIAEPLPDEWATANNEAHVEVTVLDDRVNVLYVEGYPRYEYRYLKNALLREETVELRVLLLEADRQFIQEGVTPIRHFPESPEELNKYDVVLFGDVDPRAGWLSEAQVTMLLDFVANRGGGFGLIAGERSAPHRYLGTPLERLLPVRIDPSFLGHYDASLTAGFTLDLTPQGRRSRLFSFFDGPNAEPAADAATRSERFEALPELYWIARTLGPAPAATVVAQHPTVSNAAGAMPVVVTGRYGAGKLFFQATDDTWRWRRHTGELLHDTYWVQVVRELMRGDRSGVDRRYTIRADRRVYQYGVPIRAQVEVFDSKLAALHPDSIEVVVSQRGDGGASVTGRFDVHRLGEDSNLYEGTYLPPHAGSYTLQIDESVDRPDRPDRRKALVGVRVERPDLEGRAPEADHDQLELIAEATGGRVVELDELAEVFAELPDRSVQIPDDIVEPLWDSKLSLVLFVLLIGTEWGLRKVFGLL